MTFGELLFYVQAKNEGIREQMKRYSRIAQGTAVLTALYVGGNGKDTELFEVFPFWTDDEIKEMQVVKWKNVMMSLSSKKS